MKKADATAWGRHKACFVLADKLNQLQSEEQIFRINKLINKFSNLISSTLSIDKSARRPIINLIQSHYIGLIDRDIMIEDNLKSYIKNILSRQARRYINNEPTSNDLKYRNR